MVRTQHCKDQDALINFSSAKKFEADLTSSYYSFKFLQKGTETYTIEDKKVKLTEDQLVISKPGEAVKVSVNTTSYSNGICIYISPKLLERSLREKPGHTILPSFKLGTKATLLESFYAQCQHLADPDLTISQFMKVFETQMTHRFSQASRLSGVKWQTKEHLWERLELARDLILKRFDSPIKLEDMAESSCLSPFHFQRSFKQFFQMTPLDFLKKVRMEHALQLYAAGVPLSEVALKCGYEDTKYFKKVFRAFLNTI